MIRIKDELNIKTMRVRLLRIRLSFTNTMSKSRDMKIEDLIFFKVICMKGFSVECELLSSSPSKSFLCHP